MILYMSMCVLCTHGMFILVQKYVVLLTSPNLHSYAMCHFDILVDNKVL